MPLRPLHHSDPHRTILSPNLNQLVVFIFLLVPVAIFAATVGGKARTALAVDLCWICDAMRLPRRTPAFHRLQASISDTRPMREYEGVGAIVRVTNSLAS